MKSSMAILALAASVSAVPQAVTGKIEPKGKTPADCAVSFGSKFQVSIFRVGSNEKRAAPEERQCGGADVLVMNLKDGILKDNQDRTGYISSSYQFQFDGPPQSGALFTAGFSACGNHSLAFGSSTVFWQCLSGDFYNLYDRDWAEQCEPVELVMMPCGPGSDKAGSNAKQKFVGSSIVATTVVTVVSNGETTVVPTTIAVPMCQIGDGQVQVRTTPCDNMEMPIITAAPISQISDGQLQIPSSAPPAPVGPADVPASHNPAGSPGANDAGKSRGSKHTGVPSVTGSATITTATPGGGVNPAGASDAANATGGGQAPAAVTGGPCDGPNATAAQCLATPAGVCDGPNATAKECLAKATGTCNGPNSTAEACIVVASGADGADKTTIVHQTSTVPVSRTVLKLDTGSPSATGSGSAAQQSKANSAPATPPPTSSSSTFTSISVAIVASIVGAFLLL